VGDIENVQIAISISTNAVVTQSSVALGGNYEGSLYGILMTGAATYVASRKVTITGPTIGGIYAYYNSFAWLSSGLEVIGPLPGGMNSGIVIADNSFCLIQTECQIRNCLIGNGAAFNIGYRSGLGFIDAAMVVDIDNCLIGFGVNDGGFIQDAMSTFAGGAINYIGGTVAQVDLTPGAMVSSVANNFLGGAARNFLFTSNAVGYGFDYRYAQNIHGYQPGALVGLNGYVGPAAIQATRFDLYVAQDNETIDKLGIDYVTGNGVAHTDTYTVYKNGVATTMVVALTNAATGSTVANKVSLVPGDRVSLGVATDVATAATDLVSTLKILKRP